MACLRDTTPKCTCGNLINHDKDCPCWVDWDKRARESHERVVELMRLTKVGEESMKNDKTQIRYGKTDCNSQNDHQEQRTITPEPMLNEEESPLHKNKETR